jgi:hypothetical protein
MKNCHKNNFFPLCCRKFQLEMRFSSANTKHVDEKRFVVTHRVCFDESADNLFAVVYDSLQV